MPAEFQEVFSVIRRVLASQERDFVVQSDTATDYTLVTKCPSPFPQHKGNPMWFAAVKVGKAYVSYHLLPLYMAPTLQTKVSPELKKRMQGKACFNFKVVPDKATLASLEELTRVCALAWAKQFKPQEKKAEEKPRAKSVRKRTSA
jgi:hypothetical protein